MRNHIKHNLILLGLGILEIFFIVLLILSLLPKGATTDFAVDKQVSVSSSVLNKEEGTYISQFSGGFINRGSKQVKVEYLEITVGDGNRRERIRVEGIALPARTRYTLPTNDWESSYMYDRVHSVVAVIDGESFLLANSTAGASFDPSVFLYLIPCAVIALFGVHFGKQRYYLWQEDQLLASSAQEKTQE